MNSITIYGKNPVKEAIKAGRKIHKIQLNEGNEGKILEDIGLKTCVDNKDHKINIESVDKNKLAKEAKSREHQGVIAHCEPYIYSSVEVILEKAKKKQEHPLMVILDHIQDPQNLGAIIRSVEAVGAHGIIIPKKRASDITPSVFKASSGAVEYVEIAKVSNISRTIMDLQKKWLWVVGCEGDGKQEFYKLNYDMPTVLVMGNEGRGLSRNIREKCDHLAKIPMFGKINSLNVSTACSILLYEVMRQRLG